MPIQSTAPIAIDHLIASRREALVSEWLGRIEARISTAPEEHQVGATLERQLGLIVDTLSLMAGPLRRSTKDLWFNVCEFYGRSAADRGLATGEVIEELQYLRELLIRELATQVADLSQRHVMAIVLRLNEVMDNGFADAVVGYTDQLIVTLFVQHGVPVPASDISRNATDKQLDQFEADLELIARSNHTA